MAKANQLELQDEGLSSFCYGTAQLPGLKMQRGMQQFKRKMRISLRLSTATELISVAAVK